MKKMEISDGLLNFEPPFAKQRCGVRQGYFRREETCLETFQVSKHTSYGEQAQRRELFATSQFPLDFWVRSTTRNKHWQWISINVGSRCSSLNVHTLIV